MDIEKLIESSEHCDLGDCANCPSCGRVCCKERTMGELAREVKRLQAENEKLRADIIRFNDLLASYQNVLVPELRAELEQVKRERDAAVEYLRGQCRYCKNNLVCTSRKGPHFNCWEWRGPKKED